MMLWADGFWEIRSLNDAVGIIGFGLTLFSIWLSWWLAKRDIEKRVRSAKQEVSDQLALLVLESDVAETLSMMVQARESSRVPNWPRTLDRCEQAILRIPRFVSLPGLTNEEREKLGEAVDVLRLLISYIESIIDPNKKRTELSAAKRGDLDRLVALLGEIEGRLRSKAFGSTS